MDDTGAPNVVASIAERITFASHQNDVAVIADLVVQNPSDIMLDNLELTVECEPPLIGSRVWKIDRVSPRGEVRVRDRAVPLSGALLSELSERMFAKVKLTLRRDAEVLFEKQHSLVGLAKNEWGGAAFMPDLLAAFVMPNDPSVSVILKQAGEKLRNAGEQPAIDGYQSRSRKRVWHLVSAIWTAISERRLIYALPPASFENEGQKIRTPSEVWNTGLATCLDTSILFAAALEQSGLNPVIAFTKGHALCGVWLQPQQLDSLTTEECSDIRKYVALKELVMFETTLVVNEPPVFFSKAVEEANRRIAEENEGEFVYALDLKRARSRQISPLAFAVPNVVGASVGAGDCKVILGMEAAPELPAFDIGLNDGPIPDRPETRLEHWKRQLLDLTKRNRLLNLKHSKTAIRLYCNNPEVLEDKLADGKKIAVIPMVRLTGSKGNRDNALFLDRTGEDFEKQFIQQALNNDELVADLGQADLDVGMIELYRKAKSDMEEGGTNTLFLSLGLLKWKQSAEEERTYRAPLILVPVKLERRSAASKVRIIRHEDESVFNMTLLEMLRQDFNLRIPVVEGSLPKDNSGVDVPLVWDAVRKAVRDIPGFEVVEEIVLSTFSFAKYLVWKDLADRGEVLKQNAFVRHLIDKPHEPYGHSAICLRPDEIDEKIDHSKLYMPLHADSSQIVAVHASAKGGDLVLEGPPGTGKSQTIANIIAHNLALGRKVLFVSEKMAALNVVYRRLREKKLDDFCLELHSNKADKRAVLAQLGKSLSNSHAHNKLAWAKVVDRLSGLRKDLNNLVVALHTPSATGISPREAIGRGARWQDVHRFRLDWSGGLEGDRAVDMAGLERLKEIANRLGQKYREIDEKDHMFFSDIKKSEWSNAWQSRLIDAAQSLITAIDNLLQSSNDFCSKAGLGNLKPTMAQVRGLGAIAKVVPVAAVHNLELALAEDHTTVFSSFSRALTCLGNYIDGRSKLSCDYPDEAIAGTSIEQWESEWSKATSSIWPVRSLKCWLFLGRMRKSLNLSARPTFEEDLPILRKLHATRKEMDAIAVELPPSSQWRGLQTNMEVANERLLGARALREGVARFATDIREMPALLASISVLVVDGQEMLQIGMPIADSACAFVADIEAFENALGHFVNETQTEGRLTDELSALRMKAQGIIDLQPRINSWCQWQEARREAEASGLSSLVLALESGVVDSEMVEEEFITSYCVWIAGRLVDDRPELRTFSSVSHEEKIRMFREIDQSVANLSIDYIRAKLSGEVPNEDDVNSKSAYGILNRELQKKTRHKPVRQLLAEMGQLLTTLKPCLLMSPLSVAQFLAADHQLFDLVVFDEASQITVWDAIGAIARGKNVIVVGDPRQMPPTSYFDRAASEDEQEGDGVDDLESILDEALAANVKHHRLTGHYRSRHESLISFSNHRYYNGELVTYPASETRQSAVSFRNVEGAYQRGKGRTNPEEAKAVVTEVIRRLTDPRLCSQSIGVVTLNSEQQRLINNLLDDERRHNPDLECFFSEDRQEPVFIKNLETVQGDQRDVILLSIGFGPSSLGAKTMPMNFGPLNRKGGERRLNVAITRATSEVVVFGSFDPSMIDLTRTSAQAVRDLKHYLDFAQRGVLALGESILSAGINNYDSEFEEVIAESLRKKGWNIHTQIGISKFRIDLGVVHPEFPGKYIAGIECDGATYHSSPSARDRDRVRHSILESLGWNLVRIWSTDFWIDPVRTVEKVHQRLTDLVERDRMSGIQVAI